MNAAYNKFCYTINMQEKTKAATCTFANTMTIPQPNHQMWTIGQSIPIIA